MDVKTKRKPRSCITNRCESLAEKLLAVNPSKEIMVRALKDLFLDARSEGYMQHVKDAAAFRAARAKHINDDWLLQKTAIDDMIHTKNQTR